MQTWCVFGLVLCPLCVTHHTDMVRVRLGPLSSMCDARLLTRMGARPWASSQVKRSVKSARSTPRIRKDPRSAPGLGQQGLAVPYPLRMQTWCLCPLCVTHHTDMVRRVRPKGIDSCAVGDVSCRFGEGVSLALARDVLASPSVPWVLAMSWLVPLCLGCSRCPG